MAGNTPRGGMHGDSGQTARDGQRMAMTGKTQRGQQYEDDG